jgi:hypothetical protein
MPKFKSAARARRAARAMFAQGKPTLGREFMRKARAIKGARTRARRRRKR